MNKTGTVSPIFLDQISNVTVVVKVIEHWREVETNPIMNQIDSRDAVHRALQIFQSGKLHVLIFCGFNVLS